MRIQLQKFMAGAGLKGLLASAAALCTRVQAACIAANSLCGSVLAVVDAGGAERYDDRGSLIDALALRIAAA